MIRRRPGIREPRVFTAYLAYAPLAPDRSAHAHLMLRQLAAAAVRAVLSDPHAEGRGPVTARLLVSAHPAMLSVASQVAKDFASFAEPEGGERPPPPLSAVLDGTEMSTRILEGGSEETASMAHWMHPGRIDGPLPIEQSLEIHDPSAVIVAGNIESFAPRWHERMRGWARERNPLVIHFPMFSRRPYRPAPGMDAHLVDAEALMAERMRARGADAASPWESSVAEGEEIDIEPFFPFGAAVEHAIWTPTG
jgi:hypothetical protein